MRFDMSYSKELREAPGVSIATMYNQLDTALPMYPAVLPDPDRAAWVRCRDRAGRPRSRRGRRPPAVR